MNECVICGSDKEVLPVIKNFMTREIEYKCVNCLIDLTYQINGKEPPKR